MMTCNCPRAMHPSGLGYVVEHAPDCAVGNCPHLTGNIMAHGDLFDTWVCLDCGVSVQLWHGGAAQKETTEK